SQASSADAASPHAAISLRDGTTVTGTVTSSTPSQITMNMDSGGTRTILTKDVKSVDYGDVTPAAPSAAAPSETAPASPATTAANRVDETRRQPVPPPAPAPRYHPDESAIQTKTFEVPAGTEISVRNDEMIDSGKAAEEQTYAAEVTNDVRDAQGAV